MSREDLLMRAELLELFLETGDETLLYDADPIYHFEDVIQDLEEGTI